MVSANRCKKNVCEELQQILALMSPKSANLFTYIAPCTKSITTKQSLIIKNIWNCTIFEIWLD